MSTVSWQALEMEPLFSGDSVQRSGLLTLLLSFFSGLVVFSSACFTEFPDNLLGSFSFSRVTSFCVWALKTYFSMYSCSVGSFVYLLKTASVGNHIGDGSGCISLKKLRIIQFCVEKMLL